MRKKILTSESVWTEHGVYGLFRQGGVIHLTKMGVFRGVRQVPRVADPRRRRLKAGAVVADPAGGGGRHVELETRVGHLRRGVGRLPHFLGGEAVVDVGQD